MAQEALNRWKLNADDDPPAAHDEADADLIRQARADAWDVLAWLHEVGRL